MARKNFFVVLDGTGTEVAGDGEMSFGLQDFADRIGGQIVDRDGVIVYPLPTPLDAEVVEDGEDA